MLYNKKLIRLVGLSVPLLFANPVSAAYSFDPYPYAGVTFGWGMTELTDKSISEALFNPDSAFATASSSPHHEGIAGRAYVGYQFFENFGLEFGYSKYFNSHLTTTIDDTGGTGITGNIKSKNRVQAFDLATVMTVPVHNFAFNAKIGVAFVLNHYNATFDSNFIAGPGNVDRRTRKFRFRSGAGADYYITDAISLGIAYEFILGSSGTPYNVTGPGATADDYDDFISGNGDYTPNLHLLGVNLKYSF